MSYLWHRRMYKSYTIKALFLRQLISCSIEIGVTLNVIKVDLNNNLTKASSFVLNDNTSGFFTMNNNK